MAITAISPELLSAGSALALMKITSLRVGPGQFPTHVTPNLCPRQISYDPQSADAV